MLFRSNRFQRIAYGRQSLLQGAFALLAVLVLGGCSLVAKPSPRPVSITAPGSTTVIATRPAPAATATKATPLPFPTATSLNRARPLTLTLWMPSEMVPALGGVTETIHYVGELNHAFSTTHPDLSIKVESKASYGLGGLAHMLTTTQAVMPSHLPDIIAVDTAELPALVQSDALVPLDELLPDHLWDDLFPFAQMAAAVDGVRYALPFQVDILFLAYNILLVPEPPLTWGDLADIKGGYIFPTGDGDGSAADQFVLQYLAQGGELGTGSCRLDSVIVTEVLHNYHAAMEWGAIPDNIRELNTIEDCWAIYVAGDIGMTNVDSRQYQRDRAMLKRTRYSHIPTASGSPLTLGRSWAWAIVTTDPARQQLAAEYIAVAMRKDHLASWATESFHLPTYPDILESVIEEEDYREFLERQLQHAYPYPSVRGYPLAQTAITRAIEDVLDGVSTPERASVAAAAMVLGSR